MKIALLTFASVLGISMATHAQSGNHKVNTLQPGDKMPGTELKLRNANGRDMSLKEAMGTNGTLVMFSCNTCPYVIKNQPVTAETIKYAAAHNIKVVIINSNETQRQEEDSYEAMQSYAKTHSYTVPYLVDENSKLADMFGATHTPEIFLFDKNNKLVYKGAMNDNPGSPKDVKIKYINEAIDNLIAGKKIDPNATKSVGCGIKRA